jgi:hypothetical protein
MLFPAYDQQKILFFAFTTTDLEQHSPKNILMSWVMDLPRNVVPKAAAQALLDYYPNHRDFIDGPLQRALIELIKEVRDTEAGAKVRRGGRKARLDQ